MTGASQSNAPEPTGTECEASTDVVARAVLEQSSELVGLQALDGTLLYVNRVAESLLGYAPGDVVGRSMLEFLHPDDVASVVAAQQRLVERGGTGPGLETRVRHADGSWRLLDFVTTNLLDNRAVAALLFIGRDVTERREAERILREQDAAVRLLAENATDMIARTNGEGVFTYVSPSARVVLGYEPDELVGTSVADLVLPETRATAADLIGKGNERFTLTYPVRRRDGEQIWLESSCRIVREAPSGDVVAVESSSRDVSDRVWTQERFAALVRHSWDIITLLDADGTWQYSSPGGTRLLGYAAGYDPPGGIVSIVHPDDTEVAVTAFGELLDGTRGPDAPVVFRVRATDGSYRWFETIGQNLLDDPSVRGIVLNSRDVTERLEAEAALRRRELELERERQAREREQLELALERARRFESLGLFAGGVAHDVNNLIGVITIYLKTLTSELDLTDAQREDAEKIRAATARAGRLTRQLLKFGRRGDLAAEIFDPDGLVEDVFDAVRTVENENVEFVHQAAAEPVTVRMPQTDFEQMLLNLVTNACDAMPDGGTVSLTTEIVDRDARDAGSLPPGRYVSIEVADTGTGMTDDVARTAFEPFVTTRADGEGIGLGLAIVQRVAHDAGGDVSLVSSAGRGTRVRVLLPVYSG